MGQEKAKSICNIWGYPHYLARYGFYEDLDMHASNNMAFPFSSVCFTRLPFYMVKLHSTLLAQSLYFHPKPSLRMHALVLYIMESMMTMDTTVYQNFFFFKDKEYYCSNKVSLWWLIVGIAIKRLAEHKNPRELESAEASVMGRPDEVDGLHTSAYNFVSLACLIQARDITTQYSASNSAQSAKKQK